jgi:hypothetical protein
MPDTLFPEHMPDGIYQLIGQYGQVDVLRSSRPFDEKQA